MLEAEVIRNISFENSTKKWVVYFRHDNKDKIFAGRHTSKIDALQMLKALQQILKADIETEFPQITPTQANLERADLIYKNHLEKKSQELVPRTDTPRLDGKYPGLIKVGDSKYRVKLQFNNVLFHIYKSATFAEITPYHDALMRVLLHNEFIRPQDVRFFADELPSDAHLEYAQNSYINGITNAIKKRSYTGTTKIKPRPIASLYPNQKATTAYDPSHDISGIEGDDDDMLADLLLSYETFDHSQDDSRRVEVGKVAKKPKLRLI